MTPNAQYFARTTFRTIDQHEQETTIEAGVILNAISFDEVVDPNGVVTKLPLHIARNPSWYFHKQGDMFSHACPKVSQAEYARELVRGTEGLDFECLWQLGTLEGWLPCSTPPASRNVFSACLSTHEHIEVRIEGVLVRGTKKERGHLKGYTYHPKKGAKKTRDGLFGA